MLICSIKIPKAGGPVQTENAQSRELCLFSVVPIVRHDGVPWVAALLGMGLQVVLDGGETNRHAHTGQDAAWLVLEGRARFYGKTDEDVFELDPLEGIFIPDGQDYWFESASDAPLKILRWSASDPNATGGRVNYEKLKGWQGHLGGVMADKS